MRRSPNKPISVRALALSPRRGGGRLSSVRKLGNETGDIWAWEGAGATSLVSTFDTRRAAFPVWSPDGNQIVFASSRSGFLESVSEALRRVEEDEHS